VIEGIQLLRELAILVLRYFVRCTTCSSGESFQSPVSVLDPDPAPLDAGEGLIDGRGAVPVDPGHPGLEPPGDCGGALTIRTHSEEPRPSVVLSATQ